MAATMAGQMVVHLAAMSVQHSVEWTAVQWVGHWVVPSADLMAAQKEQQMAVSKAVQTAVYWAERWAVPMAATMVDSSAVHLAALRAVL